MMKSAAILLATVGVAFAAAFLDEENFYGLENESYEDSFSRLISVSKRSTDNDTCTQAFSCQSCTTARVCRPTSDGSWSVVQTISCDAFCDYSSGTCTDEPNDICGETDSDFICMQSDGKYPDASNSSQYHVCTDYTSKKFECVLEDYRFNTYTQSCEANYTGGDFSCTEKGIKAPYSTNAQYFAYCGDNGTALVIDKCADNYQLNVTSQTCEPYCKHTGVFADPDDCTKYIECSTVWVSGLEFLVASEMTCADNTGFSADDYMCVSLDLLTNCTSSSTTTTTSVSTEAA